MTAEMLKRFQEIKMTPDFGAPAQDSLDPNGAFEQANHIRNELEAMVEDEMAETARLKRLLDGIRKERVAEIKEAEVRRVQVLNILTAIKEAKDQDVSHQMIPGRTGEEELRARKNNLWGAVRRIERILIGGGE